MNIKIISILVQCRCPFIKSTKSVTDCNCDFIVYSGFRRNKFEERSFGFFQVNINDKYTRLHFLVGTFRFPTKFKCYAFLEIKDLITFYSFALAVLFQKLILQHADVFVDYPLSYLREQRLARGSRR